jgi:hypothetical protein
VAPVCPYQRLREHHEPFNAPVERLERHIDVLRAPHVKRLDTNPQPPRPS